jgi:peroxiredoxin
VAMSYDPPAYVSKFAESRKLPFSVAIDNTGAIADRFGDVKLTPTSYLIDKHGNSVKRYVGAPDFNALHDLIDKLLTQA